MLDNHYVPEGYGIISNFNIFGVKISSYSLFVGLGLFIGIAWFFFSVTIKEKNKEKKIGKLNAYYIVLSALAFGFIGSKILFFIENLDLIIKNIDKFNNSKNLLLLLVSGKSIVGGIIGGYLGVRFVKKRLNIESVRTGNKIAPAIALGMAIGRIGCFLTGCCYGIETSLPIGINFGDGVTRIPTQLIECGFCLILFIYLLYKQKNDKNLIPGILFKQLVLFYFSFRFLIEFIRGTSKNIMFLSIYQIICILGIVYMINKIKKEKLLWENNHIKN